MEDSYDKLKEQLDNYEYDYESPLKNNQSTLLTQIDNHNAVLNQLQIHNDLILEERQKESQRITEYNMLIEAQQCGMKEQQIVIDGLEKQNRMDNKQVEEKKRIEGDMKSMLVKQAWMKEEIDRLEIDNDRLKKVVRDGQSQVISHQNTIGNMKGQITQYEEKQKILETWVKRIEEERKGQQIRNERQQLMLDRQIEEDGMKEKYRRMKKEKEQLEGRIREYQSQLEGSQQKVIEQNKWIAQYQKEQLESQQIGSQQREKQKQKYGREKLERAEERLKQQIDVNTYKDRQTHTLTTHNQMLQDHNYRLHNQVIREAKPIHKPFISQLTTNPTQPFQALDNFQQIIDQFQHKLGRIQQL